MNHDHNGMNNTIASECLAQRPHIMTFGQSSRLKWGIRLTRG